MSGTVERVGSSRDPVVQGNISVCLEAAMKIVEYGQAHFLRRGGWERCFLFGGLFVFFGLDVIISFHFLCGCIFPLQGLSESSPNVVQMGNGGEFEQSFEAGGGEERVWFIR